MKNCQNCEELQTEIVDLHDELNQLENKMSRLEEKEYKHRLNLIKIHDISKDAIYN